MKNKIIKLIAIIVIVFAILVSDVFCQIIRAEESQLTEYEIKYNERNNNFDEKYGITYEELFTQYPTFLFSDTQILDEFYEYGRSNADDITDDQIFHNSLADIFINPNAGFSYFIKEHINIFNLSSPYEEQLDEVTEEYLKYIFENEETLSGLIMDVHEKYNDILNVAEFEFSIIDPNYYANLSLSKLESVMSKAEIQTLRNKVLGKTEYFEITFGDKWSATEYFIYLIEIYDLNQEVIKHLMEYQKEGTVLYEGLRRYLDSYDQFFFDKMLEYFLNDVVIKKIGDFVITEYNDFWWSGGAWGATTIFLEFVGGFYKEYNATSTELTQFYIMDAFVTNMGMAVNKKGLEIANKVENRQIVTRTDMDEYETLYNSYLKALQMYLNYSSKLVRDKTSKQNLSYAKDFLANEYTYDTYIDICIKNISGEKSTVADIPMYRNLYTINKGESLSVRNTGNGIVAIKTKTSGDTEHLLSVGDKLIGGITINGGTMDVFGDVQISALTTDNGASVSIWNEAELVTDKLVVNGSTTVCYGAIISKEDVVIGRSSGTTWTELVGIQGEIKTDKTIKGGISANASVYLKDISLSADKGVTVTSVCRILGSNVINGDLSGTVWFTGGDTTINGCLKGNVYDCKSTIINVDSVDCGSMWLLSGCTINVKNDFKFSSGFESESDDNYIYVGGDLYAYGYTGYTGSGYTSSRLSKGTLVICGNLIGDKDEEIYESYLGRRIWHTIYIGNDFNLFFVEEGEHIIEAPSGAKFGDIKVDGTLTIDTGKYSCSIDELESNIVLEAFDNNLTITNGNNYIITVGKDSGNTLTVKNTSVYSKYLVDYTLSVTNGNIDINGNIDTSVTLINGDGRVSGVINGGVSLDNAVMTTNAVNATYLSLANSSKLSVKEDCMYTDRFTINGTDAYLYVGGNLYANGYSAYTLAGFGDYYYANGGTIELKGNIYAKANYYVLNANNNYNYYKTFYLSDTCELYLSGDSTQIVDIPSSNYISNIVQTGTGTVQFVKNNNIVKNLKSDLVIEGSYPFFISNMSGWNDYTVKTINCESEIITSYPIHYIVSSEINDENNLCTYTYMPDKLTAPSTSLASGTVIDNGTKVTLSHSNNKVKIYYTVDGSEPTAESNLYIEPIEINKDTVLKFYASLEERNSSEVVTATYTIKKFNISIDPTLPEELLTVSADTAYEGDTVTVEINEIEGRTYVENSLTVKNGSTACDIVYGKKSTFVMPRGDVVVSAKYSNNVYEIVYNADEGILPNDAVATYTYSIGTILPNPVKIGYRFEGWFDNAELTGKPIESISETDMEDKEFWAKWVEKDTIAIDVTAQEYVFNNKDASFEIISNMNEELIYNISYYQDGTEVTPINAGVYDVKIVREEDDLYMHFEVYLNGALVINKANATFDITPQTWDLQIGTMLSESIIDEEGRVKVISDVDGTELEGIFQWVEPDTVVLASDYYQAKFVPLDTNYNEVPIELYVNVSGDVYEWKLDETITQCNISSDKDEYYVGETVIIEIQPNEGYKWNQQIEILNGENELTYEVVDESHVKFRMPAGNVDISVGLALCVYDIIFEYDDTKGTLTGTKAAEYGSSASFKFTPVEGYYILDITVNNKSIEHTGGEFVVDNITGDITISVICGRSVIGLSINVDSAELHIGDTIDLDSTITPTDATNPAIEWSSDNRNVAVVDTYGVVTAIGEGTATITVTANDGSGVTATCVVSVTVPSTEESDVPSTEEPKPEKPDVPSTEEPKPEEPDIPSTEEPKPEKPVATPNVDVSYRTHVQSIGWQDYVSNGAMSGTSGMAKRLEGIEVSVKGNDKLGIQYTTHCQSYGWLPWSANGEMNGTEGEAKRLEAIKIQLTGTDKDKYDVYYRVHAQSYGWLGWASNGAPAGTAGYAKRLEGIQIVIVKKGESFDKNIGKITSARNEAYIALAGTSPVVGGHNTDAANPFIPGESTTNVAYKTHVQTYGWQGWKYNGAMSGTSGEAKRLEGINIKLANKQFDGGIAYTTHVQTYGWQGDINKPSTWKKDGEMSGTSGEAKRLEAICITLTGDMAKYYDVYYRVHAQTYGWLGWAKNGAPSGTAGYAKRLEGIQIVLVPKGGAAPADNYGGVTSTNANPYIQK